MNVKQDGIIIYLYQKIYKMKKINIFLKNQFGMHKMINYCYMKLKNLKKLIILIIK